jgi:long-chain acyl-CoA synthetase
MLLLGVPCANGNSLKLKRPQTAKKYRAELDRLYEEALAEEKPRARL